MAAHLLLRSALGMSVGCSNFSTRLSSSTSCRAWASVTFTCTLYTCTEETCSRLALVLSSEAAGASAVACAPSPPFLRPARKYTGSTLSPLASA